MIDQVIRDYRERKLEELGEAVDAIERGYYRDRFGVAEFERIHSPPEPYQDMRGVRVDGVTLYWTVDRHSGGGFYRWVSGIPDVDRLHPFLDVVLRDERKIRNHRMHRATQGLLVDLVLHHHPSLTDGDVIQLLAIASALPRERYYPNESALFRWLFLGRGGKALFSTPPELEGWAHRDRFLAAIGNRVLRDDLTKETPDEDPSGTLAQSPAPLRGLPGPRQADEPAPEPPEDQGRRVEVAAPGGADPTPIPVRENGTLVRLTV